jgi:two-component system, NarL family, sensor histidine kinase UhpB
VQPINETERLRARIEALEAQLAQSRALEQQHRETTAADITQQKHAEQALHANTEFLQAMAETLPAAICIFDPQTITYSYVSRGYERMLGHKPETLLEQGPLHVLQLVHPDDLPRINAENAAAIAAYEQRAPDAPPFSPPQFEYRFRHADGSWRWLLTYGMVFDHKSDGRIARILNISLDITAQKELEARLRTMQQELECRVADRTASLEQANQELRAEIAHRKAVEQELSDTLNHFNLMASAARVGLWDVEVTPGKPMDGQTYCYHSPIILDMLGFRPGELANDMEWLFRMMHPEDVTKMQAAIDRHLYEGVPYQDHEFRMYDRGGSLRWFSARGQAIRDEHGQPMRFSGSVIEITDRKLEEDRKLQQEEFLRGLLKTNESDRQLMAHDLHDGVLQDLTASVWQLDSLRNASSQFSDAERKRFDQTRAILRRALDEGRRLLSGLRPPILDEQGIVAALEYLAAELRQKHPLDLQLCVDVRFKRLDPMFEVTIFRIVQQALTNVAQHSRSSRAEVKLSQQSESMQLLVRDWGVGFDPTRVDKEKFGLRGIVRRTELVGGTAEIVSQPNEGTQILVRLPLPPGAAM